MKKIVLMSSDAIALPLLEELLSEVDGFQLLGVISGPDRPTGRGQRLTPNPVAAFCRAQDVSLFQPMRPNDDCEKWLYEQEIDLTLVFSYGHILSQAVLDVPRLGSINFHASLLPLLRGPSPIETAIYQQFSVTGMSLMRMVKKMDAGPLYGRLQQTITTETTSTQLRNQLSHLAVELWRQKKSDILSGLPAEIIQDERRATYTRLIKKEDGLLQFNRPADCLVAQIRAFSAWPGSFFPCHGEWIKVGSAHARKVENADENRLPGTFLGLKNNCLEIATASGILCCRELQRPTRKMLPAFLVAPALLQENS